MPRAGKGYWPGTGDLLVAFIFSFKVPKGPRIFLSLIDHIAAGGSHGARGCSPAYVHTPPTFLLDRRICLAPCTFTTRAPFFSLITTTMQALHLSHLLSMIPARLLYFTL